jgi:hypothetical protein
MGAGVRSFLTSRFNASSYIMSLSCFDVQAKCQEIIQGKKSYTQL